MVNVLKYLPGQIIFSALKPVAVNLKGFESYKERSWTIMKLIQKSISGKFPPYWKLNNTFPWVKEIMGNQKVPELKEQKNTANETSWNGANVKQRKIYSNDLGFYFTKPGKEGQMKPKINKIKRIIKSRIEIQEIDKKTVEGEKINQTKSQLVLYNINNIDKF